MFGANSGKVPLVKFGFVTTFFLVFCLMATGQEQPLIDDQGQAATQPKEDILEDTSKRFDWRQLGGKDFNLRVREPLRSSFSDKRSPLGRDRQVGGMDKRVSLKEFSTASARETQMAGLEDQSSSFLSAQKRFELSGDTEQAPRLKEFDQVLFRARDRPYRGPDSQKIKEGSWEDVQKTFEQTSPDKRTLSVGEIKSILNKE